MKKPLSKVAHNRPNFFSVLPTGPKPAQISDIFHRKLPPRDFSIMTLTLEDIIFNDWTFGLIFSKKNLDSYFIVINPKEPGLLASPKK